MKICLRISQIKQLSKILPVITLFTTKTFYGQFIHFNSFYGHFMDSFEINIFLKTMQYQLLVHKQAVHKRCLQKYDHLCSGLPNPH